ncbi:gamma-glutamylcyclotransferase [Roseomonas sp. BN140053]|uniref:gamma-glutamylcyclotransferase n=1 Tax=Roseomonas sp. BN140053 TaxID=3391898 RepID=UPI0039E839F4
MSNAPPHPVGPAVAVPIGTAPEATAPSPSAGGFVPAPQVLTRERLLDGSLQRMVRALPGATLLTDEERERSLRDTLAARPERGRGAWLFGYGSLIWNPTVHVAERRIARVEGWRRSFCLSTPAGRGSPENPGLVLALEPGGECTGVALRVAEEILEEELSVLWRREMLTGAYTPHWVPLLDRDGHAFGSGIAFTINPAGPQCCSGLSEADTVRRLATARGQLGSSAEYLFNTREGLRHLGIRDPLLDRLAEQVAAAQAKA